MNEQIENGMVMSGPCRNCGEWTQNSDGICEDCAEDIRIAEKLEAEAEVFYD